MRKTYVELYNCQKNPFALNFGLDFNFKGIVVAQRKYAKFAVRKGQIISVLWLNPLNNLCLSRSQASPFYLEIKTRGFHMKTSNVPEIYWF